MRLRCVLVEQDWIVGCQFDNIADAICWDRVLRNKGFKIAGLYSGDGPDGTNFDLLWYIDNDSFRRENKMPQEWVRRDVQLQIDQLMGVEKGLDTLRKMTNIPESSRALSIAMTQLELARLMLQDLAGKTAESF